MNHRINAVLTVLVLLATPAAVRAQATTASGKTAELEEVVVTATRRSESAQAIPVSITAITGADIGAGGATQTVDLIDMAPNMSEQGSSSRISASWFIRGIGTNNFNPNANSKVGIYVDDVYLNSPAAQGGQLFDIDRIEIARGPQGTLFGQNTTGGLIRAITARPVIGGGFMADGEVTVGSYKQLDPKLVVGFDTGENSAMRLGVYDQNRDGTQYNDLLGTRDGRTDVLSWRAKWLWKPSSDAELLVTLHGTRDRSEVVPYKQLGILNATGKNVCPNPKIGGGCTDFLGYADTPDYHHVQSNIGHSWSWLDAFGGSVVLNWQLPAFTFTSVSAYEQNTSRFLEDTDAAPFDELHGSYYGNPRQFSQEFRVTSPEQRLRWIAGLYYFHEDLDNSVAFAATGLGPDAIFGPAGIITGLPEGIGQISSMKSDSSSAFGNIDYAATEQLKLSLGLRLTRETKDVRYAAYGLDATNLGGSTWVGASTILGNILPVPLGPGGSLVPFQTIDFAANKSWNDLSGRAAVSYAFTPGVMGYVSFSKGFNSGNYNGGAFFDPTEATLVNPEILKAWEVGLKSEIAKQLRLNVDVFRYNYTDMQVFVLATSGVNTFQQLSNAAAASLYGAELELAWKPTGALLFQLGAGYTHSRFDSFSGPKVGDLTGNTLPNAPKTNFNGVARYELPIGDGTLEFQVDGKYQGHQFFSVNNDPVVAQDAYTTANAHVGYSMLKDRLTLTAWVRNLTDKQYFRAVYDIRGFGFYEMAVGDPRTFGLTVRYRTK